MLTLHSVCTYYGRVQALKGVSLHVAEGELVALIGANGAGKTTVLNTISGLTPARRGQVLLNGADITAWAPEQIVRAGASQVPEGRQVFGPLSVADNLRLGAYARGGGKQVQTDLQRVCGRVRKPSAGANSKCLPSPERSWPARACSCWMNPPQAWRLW